MMMFWNIEQWQVFPEANILAYILNIQKWDWRRVFPNADADADVLADFFV